MLTTIAIVIALAVLAMALGTAPTRGIGGTNPSSKKTYHITLNSVDLGLADVVDPTGEKVKGKEIKVGTIGDVMIGYRVEGNTGNIKVQLRELDSYQYATICSWLSGSYTGTQVIPSAPAAGTDLYNYSQPLVLHPVQNGSATNEDIVKPNACAITVPGHVKRDGQKEDMWEVEFMPFPSRTAMASAITATQTGNVGTGS